MVSSSMISQASRESGSAWATLRDIATAAIELAIARLRLGSGHQQASVRITRPAAVYPQQAALVERVAFVIPRVAARLPWRADCLVQALAARRWLARHGVDSALTLGVLRDKPTEFEAHAWLSAGDVIVTGGDISGYVPLKRL